MDFCYVIVRSLGIPFNFSHTGKSHAILRLSVIMEISKGRLDATLSNHGFLLSKNSIFGHFPLTFHILGNLHAFLLSADFVANSLDPEQGCFIWPYLCTNCL